MSNRALAHRLRRTINDFDSLHPELRPETEDLRRAAGAAIQRLEALHRLLETDPDELTALREED